MAWFTFKCKDHGEFRKSLPQREKTCKCPKCQVESPGILKLGTIQVVERLDNGAMARSVERLSDIEEIMTERDRKHTEQVMSNVPTEDEHGQD